MERPAEFVHHHRGKSSEGVLDKGAILRGLEISAGETIIDAGCGDGYMAKEFSRVLKGSGKVYAVDVGGELIEKLKKETRQTNIEAIEADVTKKVPIENCSADLIYLANVFHGFTDRQMGSFLKEVRRLLKPNGRLAIVEVEKVDSPYGPPLNLRFSPEELRQKVTLTAKALVKAGPYSYMQIFEKTD